MVTMNVLLGRLLVLATLIVLCNSSCYLILKKSNESPNECTDDEGNSHQLNSSWKTKNCMQCDCGKTEISCCSIAAIPMGYNEQKCEAILDDKTCKYKVVERKNPKKTCKFTSSIL
ncbi:beta-microseminoprotein [Erinaceus europaeus]|uniref:Beta-microseminoprotein n=1 Tax=Erinaceus europaeus TaxID=9365 RepID=A0A1S3WFZ0_ERIEU|nr:beta-microseminoprotein [Erinaceus europaeus]